MDYLTSRTDLRYRSLVQVEITSENLWGLEVEPSCPALAKTYDKLVGSFTYDILILMVDFVLEDVGYSYRVCQFDIGGLMLIQSYTSDIAHMCG